MRSPRWTSPSAARVLAIPADKTDDVRAAYLGGRSIAGLAREHDVSRGAIHTAVADLLPQHTTDHQDTLAPELPVALDMPGKVADFLRSAEPGPAERAALAATHSGSSVTRGDRAISSRLEVLP
ncbi:hypothetical protein ACPEIC_31315 [Stenotrophomonas sp. NPDC087984]